MKVDYHVHALGHLEYAHTVEHVEQVLAKAIAEGLQEIGLADHDEYAPHFRLEAVREAAERFPDLEVRQGVEVDYRPERETDIRLFLTAHPWDFAIGSVHTLGGWLFDHPDHREGYDHWDADELYKAYYHGVVQAADSDLFDIIGHLDLIKVFGCRPRGDRMILARPALEAIRDHGLCVEVNTNGWYKPVGEVYPQVELLHECQKMGIPVTTGSDAHTPAQVGRDLDMARILLQQAGYKTVTTFKQRQSRQVPLGDL